MTMPDPGSDFIAALRAIKVDYSQESATQFRKDAAIMLKINTTILVTLSACLLGLFGCGPAGPDYGSLDLSEVHGKITLDGQPLSGGLIHFQAEDGTYSYANIDAEGRYKMMFNSEQPGVLKGGKTVRIWSSRGVPGESNAGGEEEGDPDAGPRQVEQIPSRYNSRSTLTANVENASEEFNFDLKSR